MSTEKRTLHFDLGHLTHLPNDTQFTLHAPGGSKQVLTAYADAPEKLREHRKLNRALQAMPEDHHHGLTHYVENAKLCDTQTTIVQVVYPSLDDHPMPEIALRFVNIPKICVAESLAMHSHASGTRQLPRAVSHFGIQCDALNATDRDAIHLGASDIKPPYEEAKTLVFLHPELGTVNPAVAQNVFENHIEQAQSFTDLFQYIENNQPGTSTPYYGKTWAMWINPETKKEEPIPANTDLKFKCTSGDGDEKSQVDWPTIKVNGKDQQCIPQRELSGFNPDGEDSEVMNHIKYVVQEALITTKNDETLNGHLWTKQNGVTAKGKTDVSPDPAVATEIMAAQAAAPPKNEFVLKNLTSTYGTDLYPLQWDKDQQILTLPVKNWASRYLSAYVEFFEEDGTPIKKGDIKLPRVWDDKMPKILRGAFEASDEKQYLDLVGAGTAIFGIPIPPLDSVNNLSFMWPQQATTANVLMGGLGVADGFRDWDTDVDLAGVLGTGLIVYGITGLSMAFTVKIANPFMWGLKGDAKVAFYAIAGVLGVSAAVVDIGVEGTEKGGKRVLGIIAKFAASFLFGTAIKAIEKKIWKEAMEVIIAEAVGELAAEEVLIEIPIAGEILQVASVAADIAGLLATTIECFKSPATYKIEVQRKMNLKVNVGPDPANGKDGVYNWPLVGDHYVIQVKYPKGDGQQGGTVYTQAGPMPGDHTKHIEIVFEGIPAGGKIEVTANIYSENNWLAGQWDSGWVNAKPDNNDQQSVGGNITQNLVPLTPTTTYSQKQTLAYSDADEHYWNITKFSVKADLATDLDKGGAPSSSVKAAFKENGNVLDASAQVTVNTAGKDWTLADNGVDFHIWKKQISDVNNNKLYELEVQNTSHPAPVYVKPDPAPGGHALSQLQNITISNKEFELGYAWRASGQNMPANYGSTPENTQMFAIQSISTLGQPQKQIIQPTRGFTNPTFIAYNQFGLRHLFTLAESFATELDKGGAVPSDVAQEFGGFKVSLPAGATVTKVTAGKLWTIGVPSQSPAYELQMITEIQKGQSVNMIGIYTWPIPKRTNFYLDSRTYTTENQLYYLRGIDLSGPFGKSEFDYDTKKTWGAFSNLTIQDMAVHPDGYVVAVDYDNAKLLALRLPEDAVAEDKAPFAAPLSGLGLRQGLINKPTALTITADGRILILEEGNSRIQAFDIKGNPVPCFSVNQPYFPLDKSFAAALDDWQPGTDQAADAAQMKAMREQFQKQDQVTYATAELFKTPDLSPTADLNNGKVNADLAKLFVNYGYATSPAQNNTPKTVTSSYSVSTTVASKRWLVTITDTDSTGTSPPQSVVYDVRAVKNEFDVDILAVWRAYAFSVDVKSAGKEWMITDPVNAMTFSATLAACKSTIAIQELVSYMPLREESSATLKYLDIAVETKGYIYTLYQSGDQDNPTIGIDIYSPDGSVLLKQPQTGINAAKMTVNQWRSMFTLNYEHVLGPGQRTEPGISAWEPSTPGSPTDS